MLVAVRTTQQNSRERDEGRDLAGVAQQDSTHPDVRCLAWSPSTHFLASGCEDMQGLRFGHHFFDVCLKLN